MERTGVSRWKLLGEEDRWWGGYVSRLILEPKIHGGCVLPVSNDTSRCRLEAEVSIYLYGRWDDYHQKVSETEEEN